MDAGSPPPLLADGGTPPHGTLDAGTPSAGSGAPAPGHRARSCSASGAEPWMLAALALIGLVALRRARRRAA
jgi:MYXO-CTERM domain-containing protein